MAIFNRNEIEEVKLLWLDKCWTAKEIAEWFGVEIHIVLRCVNKIHINEDEFEIKNAETTEFLHNHSYSKFSKRIANRRRKRLEKAYDTSRLTRQNN